MLHKYDLRGFYRAVPGKRPAWHDENQLTETTDMSHCFHTLARIISRFMKSLWHSLFFFVSLSMPSAVLGQSPPARLDMPPMDIIVSAGDSWWFGSWLPVDSPKSIAQSVEMWADLFKLKKIYWRGQQEEMMIDYGLIRKDNLQYYEYFDIWERYLMK